MLVMLQFLTLGVLYELPMKHLILPQHYNGLHPNKL